MVREANKGDLNQLLRLYTHLHEEGIPDDEMKLEKVWSAILADMNHHIIVNEINGRIVSSCVCYYSEFDQKRKTICFYRKCCYRY